MIIPNWLSGYLTEEKAKQVERSVVAAELKTSAEIVPVIIRRSSTVEHVPLILFLGVLSLSWVVLVPLDLLWPFWQQMIVVLIMAFVSVAIGSRWSFVQRLLISLPDRWRQVFTRAELEFYHSQITKTRDSTGVLIFISLLERQVVVLADKAIDEKMPDSTWKEVVDDILSGIKNNDMGEGLSKGILRCGDILSTHFPIKADDTNELPNTLLIRDE